MEVNASYSSATSTSAGVSPARPNASLPDTAADLVDENNARGRLYFLTLTGIGPDHWGTYMDHYRKGDDGRWRFARRSVKIEGQAANSLFREEP